MKPLKSEFYGTEFLPDNQYSQEYLAIMRTALARGETDAYFEWHMVVPLEFWYTLPWAVPGRLKEAMPKEKQVYCPLFPQEHYRCHELIYEALKLAGADEKLQSMASHGVDRIRFAFSKEKPRTAKEYGRLQRKRHKNTDWKNMNELLKYHPEHADRVKNRFKDGST